MNRKSIFFDAILQHEVVDTISGAGCPAIHQHGLARGGDHEDRVAVADVYNVKLSGPICGESYAGAPKSGKETKLFHQAKS